MNERLHFDTHVTNICNRVSKKLHILPRISQFMSILKRRITMKAFIASEFGCCPLVRMFHIRKFKSRIDKLRESALRIIFKIKHLHLLNSLGKIIRQPYTTEMSSFQLSNGFKVKNGK